MSTLSEKASSAGPWMAESMRLTFFPQGQAIEPKIFQRLTGNEPDIEQTTKRGSTSTELAAGKVGPLHLNIVSQPARVDVHVSVSPSPENPSAVVADAAEFEGVVRSLAERAGTIGAVLRIGAGASLIKICRDASEVYSIIKTRFPCLGIDPNNCDDLILQINSPLAPKDASTPRINKIDRWSHGVFESINIPISGQIQTVSIPPSRIEGVKLDLDYNTSPLSEIIIKDKECSRITLMLIDLISAKAKSET